MKKFNSIYPDKKEDLIGSYKRCFWCKKKIKITKDGAQHSGKNHIIKETLEELYNMRVYEIEFEHRMFFGYE